MKKQYLGFIKSVFKGKKICIIIFLLTFSSVYAQEQCGTDILHDNLMKTDSVYRKTYNQNQEKTRLAYIEYLNNKNRVINASSVTIAYIPINFHILQVNGDFDVSDVNITKQVTLVNNINSNRTNTSLSNTGIQFYIKNIYRVNASSISNYAANGFVYKDNLISNIEEIYNYVNYNYYKSQYNVYIVNKINGTTPSDGSYTAGSAYFPGSTDYHDLAIVRYDQFDSSSITLVHELGHSLNLHHTFYNPTCGSDQTNTGDLCADTPPHDQSTCDNSNYCSNGLTTDLTNSIKNIMSYCQGNNRILFSNDQAFRLWNALNLTNRNIYTTYINYSISTSSSRFNFQNNTGSIYLTASPNNSIAQWYITNIPSWVTFSNISGTGTSNIRFSLSQNTSTSSRVANININGIIYTISQAGAIIYSVSLSSNSANSGTTSGAGNYYADSSVTITATPNSGYFFTNWTENGTAVSSNASYTFTINANRSLVANFTLCPNIETPMIVRVNNNLQTNIQTYSKYEWYKDNIILNGYSTYLLQSPNIGVYTVKGFNQNLCPTNLSKKYYYATTCLTPTGRIGNGASIEGSVIDNPSQIVIKWCPEILKNFITILVLDINGNKVLQQKVPANLGTYILFKNTINATQYFIQVLDENNELVQLSDVIKSNF